MKAPGEVPEFKLGLYKHWKGPMYLAVGLGQDSNNGPDGTSTQEPTVAYYSLDAGDHQGHLCFRWLKQWNEVMADGVQRFTFVRGVS